MRERKIDKLAAHMRSGNWQAALSLAAKFPHLGAHAGVIRRAHEASHRPAFYRQLGLDPEQLVRAGVEALKERYGRWLK